MSVQFNNLDGTHKCGICLNTDDKAFVAHEGGLAHPYHRLCLLVALKDRKVCPGCKRTADGSSLYSKDQSSQDEQMARLMEGVDHLKTQLTQVGQERDSLQAIAEEQRNEAERNRDNNNQIPLYVAQVAQLNNDLKSANRRFYIAVAAAVVATAIAILY